MFVVATAGHVDHGKSTLIRALTGMEPDRWAEERRRGMTIDLGYAWVKLPDGQDVAFVDVPGHERFMTNMLAGIGAVPTAMIVVAADEGWGRQTSEHLRALVCLGIRHALLVATRADLGDGELAVEEARSYLAETPLRDIESVITDGVSGRGIPDLLDALVRLGSSLPPPPDAPPRLWVDRSFSLRGSGTVVTGTLPHGCIRQGDEFVNSRTGAEMTVRSIESLKQRLAQVSAVARVALNLRGVAVEEVHRGDALIAAGDWLSVIEFDAELVEPLERFPRGLHLHIGSAFLSVTARRLGNHHVRVKLPSPLPLHCGDRGILREPGGRIVAGIVILDPLPPSLRRRGAAVARSTELSSSEIESLASQIRIRKIASASMLQKAGFNDDVCVNSKDRHVVGDWLIDAEHWSALQRRLSQDVDTHSSANPMSPALNSAHAMRELQLPDMKVLAALVDATGLELEGVGIHRSGVRPVLPAEAETALSHLEAILRKDQFEALELAALHELGLDEKLLAVAVQLGRLIKVAHGVYLLPGALELAEKLLSGLPGAFTVADARSVLGGTRRGVVPLLECLDRSGVTRRINESQRELRVRHESS